MKIAKIILSVCSIVFVATQAIAGPTDRVKRAKSNQRHVNGAHTNIDRIIDSSSTERHKGFEDAEFINNGAGGLDGDFVADENDPNLTIKTVSRIKE